MPRRRQSSMSRTRSASLNANSSEPSRPMSPRDRHSRSRSSGTAVRRLSSSSVSLSGIEKPPLAQYAGELRAPGGPVWLQVARLADDEGDGVFAAVAHADVELRKTDALCALLR